VHGDHNLLVCKWSLSAPGHSIAERGTRRVLLSSAVTYSHAPFAKEVSWQDRFREGQEAFDRKRFDEAVIAFDDVLGTILGN
jgi:hypothetical protein